MTLYRVFPDPRLAIDDTTPDGLQTLRELYRIPSHRSVRVNMVVTPTGETAGPDNTSGTLSRGGDRALVRLLREAADAVLIGAASLRVERIPVPREGPLVVLSRSGDIAAQSVVFLPDGGELVVITPSPDRARVSLRDLPHRIIPAPPAALSPSDIIDLCAFEGWSHLLVEGGEKTATSFAEAGVVDDLCLTLTGAPREQTTPPLTWWPTRDRWETQHLLTDDHRMLYYRLGRVAAESD